MYECNIYVKNHAKVNSYSGDIGVKLDKYDAEYKMKYDALARAQYKFWVLSKNTSAEKAKSQMSVAERQLLGI